ncbi:hypothetical protein GCM10027093_69830 [Paraburkholderia jirisanensis]
MHAIYDQRYIIARANVTDRFRLVARASARDFSPRYYRPYFDVSVRVPYAVRCIQTAILMCDFQVLLAAGFGLQKLLNFRRKHLLCIVERWQQDALDARQFGLRLVCWDMFLQSIGKKALRAELTALFADSTAWLERRNGGLAESVKGLRIKCWDELVYQTGRHAWQQQVDASLPGSMDFSDDAADPGGAALPIEVPVLTSAIAMNALELHRGSVLDAARALGTSVNALRRAVFAPASQVELPLGLNGIAHRPGPRRDNARSVGSLPTI